MKKKDYRNALDKIKCSDDFCVRIKDKLKTPVTESHEYADTVSHLEKAKPRSLRNIAIGTAACIAVGICALGFYKLVLIQNSIDSPLTSDIETSSDFTESGTAGINQTVTEVFESSNAENDNCGELSANESVIQAVSEAIEKYNSNESVEDTACIMFIEGDGQFDTAYPIGENSIEQISEIISSLKNLNWKRAEKIDYGYTSSASQFRNRYMIYNIVAYSFGLSLSDNSGYSYYVPSNSESAEKYTELYDELQQIRFYNIENVLSAGYARPIMSADIDVYDVVSKNNVNSVYETSGKVYYNDWENPHEFTYTEGTRYIEGDTSNDKKKTIECCQNFNSTVSVLERIIDDSAGYREENYQDNIVTYKKSSDCDYLDYTPLPGDYFGLKASIVKALNEDIVLSENDQLSDHIMVTFDTDENGYFLAHILISSNPLYMSKAPEWSINFTINDFGFITQYNRTEYGKEVSRYELRNISYEEFDMPEINEKIKNLTDSQQTTEESSQPD